MHDIASITDYNLYKEHHIYGSRIVAEILSTFNYTNRKIEMVQKCILNHRGSKLLEKSTIEEICVADAISHFDNLPSLFHLAYIIRKYSIPEATDFVKRKLERSYNKMSDESKELYKVKYDHIISSLN